MEDPICLVSQMNTREREQPSRAWCNNIIWQELNRPAGSQWIIPDKWTYIRAGQKQRVGWGRGMKLSRASSVEMLSCLGREWRKQNKSWSCSHDLESYNNKRRSKASVFFIEERGWNCFKEPQGFLFTSCPPSLFLILIPLKSWQCSGQ